MDKKIDYLIDMLVYAQCFVDGLEYFEKEQFEERKLFRFNLKKDVKRIISQICNSVNTIFHNIKNPEGAKEVSRLYDIHYALHAAISKLSLDDKIELTKQLNNR
jgi:hypothetical protein